MQVLLAFSFLVLHGCGRGETHALTKFACGDGLPCGDVYSRDLLQADTTTIDALRTYVLNKNLARRYATTPFKQEGKGQGDIDDLLRGLMLVKELYGINPIFALALSIHESGWGTSSIARGRHNLWGWNAVDGQEYRAATFVSYTQGFNTVFNRIKHSYLSPDGRFYKSCDPPAHFPRYSRQGGCSRQDCGASLAGMSCMYASDNGWANAVRGHMNDISAYLNDHASPATGCAAAEL